MSKVYREMTGDSSSEDLTSIQRHFLPLTVVESNRQPVTGAPELTPRYNKG
jgi:hypothetical protein